MTVWLVVAIAAAAETTATADVVIGVTGNPEATLEQPTGTPARALEPQGTAAILLGARRSWKGGPWLALSGEASCVGVTGAPPRSAKLTTDATLNASVGDDDS